MADVYEDIINGLWTSFNFLKGLFVTGQELGPTLDKKLGMNNSSIINVCNRTFTREGISIPADNTGVVSLALRDGVWQQTKPKYDDRVEMLTASGQGNKPKTRIESLGGDKGYYDRTGNLVVRKKRNGVLVDRFF